MKTPIEKSESLKKALDGSKTFDEASYYKSKQVEMGGDDILDEKDDEFEEDDEEFEDHEFYGDDD
jgi:hypothetical protein